MRAGCAVRRQEIRASPRCGRGSQIAIPPLRAPDREIRWRPFTLSKHSETFIRNAGSAELTLLGFDRAMHDVDSTWQEIFETGAGYDSVLGDGPRILL